MSKTKRQLKGKVISDKMDKTIVVEVESKSSHPFYQKIMKSHKKYKVHDEEEKASIGDNVTIEETIPSSKKKTWKLVSID